MSFTAFACGGPGAPHIIEPKLRTQDLKPSALRGGSSTAHEARGHALAVATRLAVSEGYDLEVWSQSNVNEGGHIRVVQFTVPQRKYHFEVHVQQDGGAAELVHGLEPSPDKNHPM